MSEQLDRVVARLHDAARRLREEDLSPQAAAGLVDELARAAAEAGAELDRVARAAPSAPAGDGQLGLGD